jgi:DNA-binding MarR family transcriptional regulator
LGVGVNNAAYAEVLRFRRELRGFLQWSESAARDAGLTPAVHQLLLTIRASQREGGPTIGDVAAELGVRHHSAVELAQRAEELDLLTRERSGEDHRQVRLTLTPSGRHRLEELTRLHLPRIQALADVLAAVTADRVSLRSG